MKCKYEDKECSSTCIHKKTCYVYKLAKGEAPCKECSSHTSTCHADCEKYKIWSNARRERLDKINKERKKDCESYDRAREAVKRMQTHRNRRNR